MDVTHFALTLLVGRPNDEKSALTCVQIDLDQSEHKSSQVSSSARKAWPNGVAQVFNLRLLATPFGQGFRFEILGADQNGRASGEENEESGECDGVCEKNFGPQTHHSKTDAMRNAMNPGMNYNHLSRPAQHCRTATLPLPTICIF